MSNPFSLYNLRYQSIDVSPSFVHNPDEPTGFFNDQIYWPVPEMPLQLTGSSDTSPANLQAPDTHQSMLQFSDIPQAPHSTTRIHYSRPQEILSPIPQAAPRGWTRLTGRRVADPMPFRPQRSIPLPRDSDDTPILNVGHIHPTSSPQRARSHEVTAVLVSGSRAELTRPPSQPGHRCSRTPTSECLPV